MKNNIKEVNILPTFDVQGMGAIFSAAGSNDSIPVIVRSLGDLVDNSVDAGATSVYIKYNNGVLSISDNGSGMSLDDLKSYQSFGGSTKRDKDTIGYYGAGGKIACLSLGKSYEIRTRKGLKGDFLIGKMNSFEQGLKVSLGNAASKDCLNAGMSTTIVIKLKKEVDAVFRKAANVIIERLASLYYGMGNKLKIYDTGKLVKPIDTSLTGHSICLAQKVFKYSQDNKTNIITITANFVKHDILDIKKKVWYCNGAMGGFYVRMFSGREIVTASPAFMENLIDQKLGNGSSNYTNLRILAVATEKFGIEPTVTKDAVNIAESLSHDIRNWIEEVVFPEYIKQRDKETQEVNSTKNQEAINKLSQEISRLLKLSGPLAGKIESQFMEALSKSANKKGSGNSSNVKKPRFGGVDVKRVAAPISKGAVYCEVVNNFYTIYLNTTFKYIEKQLNGKLEDANFFLRTIVLPESLMKMDLLLGKLTLETPEDVNVALDEYREKFIL